MTDIPATTTRYERVKQILDRAAGASTADYGGRGPFWHLPIDELRSVSVAGVRMIAPAEDAGACACCEPVSRSTRSGLVRGLRGEAPFDGSQYPRLPWGGPAVNDGDIQLISARVASG